MSTLKYNGTVDDESIVDKIVQSLSFEVEVVPQENVIKVSKTENTTPFNVKIRVRKNNDFGLLHHGVISVPKFSESNSKSKERIRLVSSDQTIMSFILLMEADIGKKTMKKPRKHFFNMFKTGGCLGTGYDDDESPYMPSSSDKNHDVQKLLLMQNKNSKEADHNQNIKKLITNNQKYFFGKCKPGGCLDPPFGEDKYSFKPVSEEPDTDIRKKEKLSLTHEMMKGKNNLTSHSSQITKKMWPNVKENGSKTTVTLFETESMKNSLQSSYSNSIITYPPAVSSRDLLGSKDNYGKHVRQRSSGESKPKRQSSEVTESYFIPTKSNYSQKQGRNSADGDQYKNIYLNNKDVRMPIDLNVNEMQEDRQNANISDIAQKEYQYTTEVSKEYLIDGNKVESNLKIKQPKVSNELLTSISGKNSKDKIRTQSHDQDFGKKKYSQINITDYKNYIHADAKNESRVTPKASNIVDEDDRLSKQNNFEQNYKPQQNKIETKQPILNNAGKISKDKISIKSHDQDIKIKEYSKNNTTDEINYIHADAEHESRVSPKNSNIIDEDEGLMEQNNFEQNYKPQQKKIEMQETDLITKEKHHTDSDLIFLGPSILKTGRDSHIDDNIQSNLTNPSQVSGIWDKNQESVPKNLNHRLITTSKPNIITMTKTDDMKTKSADFTSLQSESTTIPDGKYRASLPENRPDVTLRNGGKSFDNSSKRKISAKNSVFKKPQNVLNQLETRDETTRLLSNIIKGKDLVLLETQSDKQSDPYLVFTQPEDSQSDLQEVNIRIKTSENNLSTNTTEENNSIENVTPKTSRRSSELTSSENDNRKLLESNGEENIHEINESSEDQKQKIIQLIHSSESVINVKDASKSQELYISNIIKGKDLVLLETQLDKQSDPYLVFTQPEDSQSDLQEVNIRIKTSENNLSTNTTEENNSIENVTPKTSRRSSELTSSENDNRKLLESNGEENIHEINESLEDQKQKIIQLIHSSESVINVKDASKSQELYKNNNKNSGSSFDDNSNEEYDTSKDRRTSQTDISQTRSNNSKIISTVKNETLSYNKSELFINSEIPIFEKKENKVIYANTDNDFKSKKSLESLEHNKADSSPKLESYTEPKQNREDNTYLKPQSSVSSTMHTLLDGIEETRLNISKDDHFNDNSKFENFRDSYKTISTEMISSSVSSIILESNKKEINSSAVTSHEITVDVFQEKNSKVALSTNISELKDFPKDTQLLLRANNELFDLNDINKDSPTLVGAKKEYEEQEYTQSLLKVNKILSDLSDSNRDNTKLVGASKEFDAQEYPEDDPNQTKNAKYEGKQKLQSDSNEHVSPVMVLDLAFQSHFSHAKQANVIKTIDPSQEVQRYPNDTITIMQSTIRNKSDEITFPVDNKKNMTLHFVLKDKNRKATENKNISRQKAGKSSSSHPLQSKYANEIIIAQALTSVYEKQLVPLQEVIKNLKEEIDELAQQQERFRDNLLGIRKSKSMRLLPTNENCGCLM